MSEHAAPHFGTPPTTQGLRATAREATGYWWVWLVAGIAWTIAALVILQFDQASITTIGILVGLLFVFAGIENIALSMLDVPWRWLWAVFGVLFLIASVICFVNPKDTFAGIADILGFLFLLVGVWWMVEAFLEKAVNPSWWLRLIAGILMTVVAFWTAGQFFITKAYTLLVFAGIWALMRGVGNIIRAFEVRQVHTKL